LSAAIILYAPNVHTGGGVVLLRALLDAWPASLPLRAFLDARARPELVLPTLTSPTWVQPAAGARLAAEWQLRAAAEHGDTVLCFHGLPPLLRSAGRVVVFQQNRNYLGLTPLRQFAPRTALRLAFERLVSRVFRGHADEYIVQTPTMARALSAWHGGEPVIRVLPFAGPAPAPAPAQAVAVPAWDFVYVSDGEAHKNHRRLFQAWGLLAAQGIRPRLALTLGPRDKALADEADALRESTGAEVHNLGHVSHAKVLALYAAARALIFPSLGESFGLPLIEARQLGLPILASELDFVRDVCEPVHTFDPLSPVSIARAVRRFLDQSEPVLHLQRPEALWEALDVMLGRA
jgi:hypothetical protein